MENIYKARHELLGIFRNKYQEYVDDGIIHEMVFYLSVDKLEEIYSIRIR